MKRVSSWGRLNRLPHQVVTLTEASQVSLALQTSPVPGLAFGAGRSYGDVCLNPGHVLWETRGLDHFVRFDESTGLLRCEAGVLLRDIHRVFVPRGWMLPVTPGTELITVGGAVANDVHGKNHHRHGTFGDHVEHFTLLRTDGRTIEAGPELRPEWFAATVGGMGLTGVISEITLRLRRIAGPWLETETLPYRNVDEFFDLADDSERDWEHTVSWIDCLSAAGRGLFMRARESTRVRASEPPSRERSLPLAPPFSGVNRLTLHPFNAAYFHLKKRNVRSVEHYRDFLYPLDQLSNWNVMYGPRGFFQYQCAIPSATRKEAIEALLAQISGARNGSFLAVLKTFGNRKAPGLMSFAQPGATLALDFPNQGDVTLRLFEQLDAIVSHAGGRLYVAKDARMPRELFESGYPGINEFARYRDPGISSALSRRLLGS